MIESEQVSTIFLGLCFFIAVGVLCFRLENIEGSCKNLARQSSNQPMIVNENNLIKLFGGK